MTKILNLDTLEGPVEKSLVLNGKTYLFKPFTVEEFIAQMKASEAKDADAELKTSDVVEHMVSLVLRAFPTMPEAELRAQPLERLKLISDFASDVNQEEASEVADEAKKELGEPS